MEVTLSTASKRGTKETGVYVYAGRVLVQEVPLDQTQNLNTTVMKTGAPARVTPGHLN